jgi:hypothetical protein
VGVGSGRNRLGRRRCSSSSPEYMAAIDYFNESRREHFARFDCVPKLLFPQETVKRTAVSGRPWLMCCPPAFPVPEPWAQLSSLASVFRALSPPFCPFAQPHLHRWTTHTSSVPPPTTCYRYATYLLPTLRSSALKKGMNSLILWTSCGQQGKIMHWDEDVVQLCRDGLHKARGCRRG